MNSKTLFASVVLVSGIVSTAGLFAQGPGPQFPAPSPACTLKQRVGLTDIEIVYSRPGMKGRAVYGGVVPYGEVWRTGANAATKLTFSTAVKLNGAEVPAGSYALYTIPGKDEWTVIIYKDTTGSYTSYSPSNDLVRIKAVPVKLTEPVETFTIDVNDIRDESATLNVVWEKTRVPVKIELDLAAKLLSQIDAAMAATEGRKPYFQAAQFYFDHGMDLQKARQWIDAAVAERETYFIVHLKAKILAKQGDKAGALAAAKRSTELAVTAKDNNYVRLNEDLMKSLK